VTRYTSLRDQGINATEVQEIMKAGPANVREAIRAAELPTVLESYNNGTFCVATAGSAVAPVAELVLEWRNIKPKSTKATAYDSKLVNGSYRADSGGWLGSDRS